jgi:hypothetical protein
LKRLNTLDKWLVLILVPLYAVCLVLGLMTQIRGGGYAMLTLSLENTESYPAVTGEFDPLHFTDPLERAGLRPGDRLIRLGSADLRGVGAYGFFVRSRTSGGRGLSAPLVYERGGERHETSLPRATYATFRPWLVASLAFAASALFLFLRARPTPMARAYFHAGFCIAFALCTPGAVAPSVQGSYAAWAYISWRPAWRFRCCCVSTSSFRMTSRRKAGGTASGPGSSSF